jgi:hypothetical protein
VGFSGGDRDIIEVVRRFVEFMRDGSIFLQELLWHHRDEYKGSHKASLVVQPRPTRH